MKTNVNQAAVLKELDLLKAECPRTHAALDRPMSAHASMLSYRTAQVDALIDASSKLERERKRLVAALRGEYPGAVPYEQWAQEKHEGGLVSARAIYHAEMRHELLRELGEAT